MSENERDLIENEAHEHKYFHKMLNMAEDDLDPFEYRLLAHYVRWSNLRKRRIEGYKKTAKLCKMSPAKLLQARQALIDKGYIKYNAPTAQQANRGIGGTVVIVDRWLENIERYSEPSPKIDKVDSKPGLNLDNKKERSTGKKEDKNLSSLKNATGVETDLSVKGKQPANSQTNTQDPLQSSAKVSPAKLPRPQDPIYNAVAECIFGITDAETLKLMQEKESAATRIGIIVSWLNGKTDSITYGKTKKFVGKINGTPTPEHVKTFAAWYARKNSTASMIRDGEKFVEYWRQWASTAKKTSMPRPTTPAPTTQPLTDAQRQHRQAELAARRNGVTT